MSVKSSEKWHYQHCLLMCFTAVSGNRYITLVMIYECFFYVNNMYENICHDGTSDILLTYFSHSETLWFFIQYFIIIFLVLTERHEPDPAPQRCDGQEHFYLLLLVCVACFGRL